MPKSEVLSLACVTWWCIYARKGFLCANECFVWSKNRFMEEMVLIRKGCKKYGKVTCRNVMILSLCIWILWMDLCLN